MKVKELIPFNDGPAVPDDAGTVALRLEPSKSSDELFTVIFLCSMKRGEHFYSPFAYIVLGPDTGIMPRSAIALSRPMRRWNRA